MSHREEDRRVERTRRAIRHGLLSLMLEKRYEKITVQEIIDRANVGRSTFYNHFQDKDDLLLRGIAEIPFRDDQESSGFASRRAAAENREAGGMHTAGMFEHSRQNHRLHRVMFKQGRENPILEKVTRFLHERVEQELSAMAGSGDPDVPEAVIAHFMTGGLLSLIRWWHDNGFPYTPEEMDSFVKRIVMPGLQDVLGPDSSA